MLAIITKMTLTQVSTWFANARRRLKKENKMTWEPKNRVDDDDDVEADVENDDGEHERSSASDSTKEPPKSDDSDDFCASRLRGQSRCSAYLDWEH